MTSQKMAEKTAPGVSPSNKATMKMKKLSESTSRTLEADQVPLEELLTMEKLYLFGKGWCFMHMNHQLFPALPWLVFLDWLASSKIDREKFILQEFGVVYLVVWWFRGTSIDVCLESTFLWPHQAAAISLAAFIRRFRDINTFLKRSRYLKKSLAGHRLTEERTEQELQWLYTKNTYFGKVTIQMDNCSSQQVTKSIPKEGRMISRVITLRYSKCLVLNKNYKAHK